MCISGSTTPLSFFVGRCFLPVFSKSGTSVSGKNSYAYMCLKKFLLHFPTFFCRATKSRKLVGFISAVPASISVYKKVVKMVEINFLCVHKKLRAKRVAPVLIRQGLNFSYQEKNS